LVCKKADVDLNKRYVFIGNISDSLQIFWVSWAVG
jgi:hypothetical protein